MNRNENNDFRNKNHYADFDRHGNPLTGNTHSLSHYNPRGAYGDYGDRYGHEGHHRDTNAAHAYGDYGSGTRYGEGGSNKGGGSSYGHSYYGLSGNEGPRMTQHELHWDESRRYDAYGDRAHNRDRDQRFSDSFGRSRDGGYVNEGRNREERGYTDRYEDSRQGARYGGAGRENTGYNRGYDDFGRTGYGATSYNNRDVDRERSAYGSRQDRDRWTDERNYYNTHQNW
ncbi:hypothetical protein [Pontibacter anaerobius]|uniref:SWFGD domain-containing protein n=1 Tax=Pontibacter anaerobius TaxID=2993940 RepID=A0ABT3RHG3_9BACT|nr:hypothetical protein [Pontibacter anaerobius]MCX2740941.1 hypothetical protein [Pontibacter anaerobius]